MSSRVLCLSALVPIAFSSLTVPLAALARAVWGQKLWVGKRGQVDVPATVRRLEATPRRRFAHIARGTASVCVLGCFALSSKGVTLAPSRGPWKLQLCFEGLSPHPSPCILPIGPPGSPRVLQKTPGGVPGSGAAPSPRPSARCVLSNCLSSVLFLLPSPWEAMLRCLPP